MSDILAVIRYGYGRHFTSIEGDTEKIATFLKVRG